MLKKIFKTLDKGADHCKRMFTRSDKGQGHYKRTFVTGASKKLAVLVTAIDVNGSWPRLDVPVCAIFMVGTGEHLQGVMKYRTFAKELTFSRVILTAVYACN